MTSKGKKRQDSKQAIEKPIIYVPGCAFNELIELVRRVWGADSVAYQVLILEYLLSTESLLSDQDIKRDYVNETAEEGSRIRLDFVDIRARHIVMNTASQRVRLDIVDYCLVI